MALIAAKCPSCGGDIQLDDSREFGFCLHCGTKVIVQDAVQKIKVSGSVKLDMSDTAVNCLNLADQAFKNENYLEAYNYYTKMLEYDSSSYKATFRKGLCAGYLSDQTSIRTNELISGYKQASDMLGALIEKGNSADVLYAEQKTITEELYDFTMQCSSIIKNLKYGAIFSSREDIDTYLKTGMSITNMLAEVNGVIDTKYEDRKKNILSTNIDVCTSVLNNSRYLKYSDGFTIDKNGNKQAKYSFYTIGKDISAYFETQRSTAVTNYNNLPSNREGMENLNNAIAHQNDLIQRYKDSVSDFWASNGEKYKGYKRIKTLSVVFLILGILISLIIFVFLPALGLILLAAVIVLKAVLPKRMLDSYENTNFTPELLQDKEEHKRNIEILDEKTKEKKKFEATLKK